MKFFEMSLFPQVCCFTGHRPSRMPWGYEEENSACLHLKEVLKEEILSRYLDGTKVFITGMAQGIDTYCAEIVLDLKDTMGSDISLEAACPCKEQADRWTEEAQQRYHKILEACTEVKWVQDRYDSNCMMKRNKYMVDRSELIISVYDGSKNGGTYRTLEYGKKLGKERAIFDFKGNYAMI